MKIIPIDQSNLDQAAQLAAQFRVALKSYQGIAARPDPAAGKQELEEYLQTGFPCFAAEEAGKLAGYLVCRVEEPCVWVESIFTSPDFRRKGVASALLEKAEALAASYGEETVFHYVHPNNHGMIGFLASHGYTVLNLIELRKPYSGERPGQKIQVGEHWFD